MGSLLATAALALGEWRSRRQFAARAARLRNPDHTAPGPPGEEDGASCLLPLMQLASVWLSLQVVAVVWHLCELLATPQAPFVKRQVRKLLLLICGSRDQYRQLRDMHTLETKMR